MQQKEHFQPSWRRADRNPDRPPVKKQKVSGNGAKIAEYLPVPLTPFQEVRGQTIGGGTSVDATRRARRRLANGSH